MSAIGLALHAWSQLESAMWQLFGHVGGMGQQKAEAVFAAIAPFEIRVAVLDAAIACETEMSDEEKELWAGLSALLRKLYEERHEVAHFGLAPDPVNEMGIAPFARWGTDRHKAHTCLTHDQIAARANSFAAAAQAVEWFQNVARKRKPPLLADAPLQEPELVVRIRESLARAKAGQPRQPEVDLE